jgi:ABC-2 type transport system ATP-binding protein
MNDSLVVCQQVSKIFKDFWMRDRARAVNGLSFEIRPREIFGLLGPNGSGKSTTIKMILGLLRPTSGRIALFGKSPTDVAVKRRIGYLPEESYLYGFLNARETLDYYGKLFELDHRTRTRRIDELLDMLGLANAQFRPVREYSKGMQRRIGIAQALINDPDLLILDEPTTGLDPLGTRQIKDLILELGRRGKTVLLSSHLLADVEDCVDRLIILYGGTKRAEGTCDDLLVSQSRTSIEADTLDEETVAEIDRLIRLRSQGAKSITKVARPRQTLEALFIDIVEKARAEIATSGAMSGGETASFLKAEEAEGDQLISRLTATEAPATSQAAAAAKATSAASGPNSAPESGPDSGPDSGMIGSLLQTPAAEPSPAATPAAVRSATLAAKPSAPAAGATTAPATPNPAPAQDIDTSVIGGLLGEASDDERSKGSGPRGGGR